MTAQHLRFRSSNFAASEPCPFFDSACSVCRAARLSFAPDDRHLRNYCCNDNHDACALFLAKALRSSSPGGQARDAAAHCEK